MALQPLQLQACPMEAEQGTSQHAAMQDHAGMQDQESHGCCGTDLDTPSQACDEAMPCGSCSLGINLIQSSCGSVAANWSTDFHNFDDGQIAAPHSNPPFRPPIS